jgi:pSer/pThr/pTyr-binding forkhead associated (FHA) protein
MRDGFTRKIATPQRDEPFEDFSARWQATLVVLSGDAAGTEWLVEKSRSTLGRAAECDFVISDGAMSKEHAALEFVGGGFRLRDLGSMNGMRVNGSDVKAADLKSGDRFQLGEHVFQFVLEAREKSPRTWVLPDSDADSEA